MLVQIYHISYVGMIWYRYTIYHMLVFFEQFAFVDYKILLKSVLCKKVKIKCIKYK